MTSHTVVRLRADWIRVLEAAHAAAETDGAWAEAVIDAARVIFPRAVSVGMYVLEHGPDLANPEVTTMAPRSLDPFMQESASLFQMKELVYPFHYPRAMVSTHLEIVRGLDAQLREIMAHYRRGLGVVDAVGLVTNPAPGIVTVLYAIHDAPVALNPHERRLLTRVALHLDAAYRLRRRPEAQKAELTSEGRLLSREPDAPPENVLEAHAARIIEARSTERRATAEAVELWPALLSGRVSLVPRGAARHTHYAVVENPPMTWALRALTLAETNVVRLSARGLSTKLVAYALGLAPSTVSARLASAASKFGVASRAELVRIGSMLDGGPRREFDDGALTQAERDILGLLRRGLSNRQIAELRARSVRTVANQVASLLRKTGNTSRRALVAASPSDPAADRSGMLAPSCAESPRP